MTLENSTRLEKRLRLTPASTERILNKFHEAVETSPSSKRWTYGSQHESPPQRQQQVGDQWTKRVKEGIVLNNGIWTLQRIGTQPAAILCMEEVAMFIIDHLKTGKHKDQIHEMVKSTPGLLEKDIRLVFKLIRDELSPTLLPTPPCSSGGHQNTCQFSQYNGEQRYLFYDDPRGQRLRAYYEQQITCRSKTPRKIGDVEIRRASKSLEIAIPGKARHLGCSCSLGDGDFLIMTEDEHYKWAEDPTPDIVVIRDKRYIERSGQPFSAEQFRDALRRLPSGSTVTIQDWSKEVFAYRTDPRTGKRRKVIQMAANRILVSKALEDWKSYYLEDHRAPHNMLSIQELTPRSPPSGFAKYYSFLDEAISHAKITSKAAIDPSNTTIGKDNLRFASDISECRRFTLFGEKRMSSGCHIDLMGVSTGVTVEPSTHRSCSGSAAGLVSDDSSPLKYWLVVSLKDCTAKQTAKEMERFVHLGAEYIPELPARFIAISIVEGDTLIIPPGCIHGPITVTNCLMRGFMGVHPRQAELSINTWHWLDENRDCTNEDPHLETRRILEFYVRAVSSDPTQYRVTDLGTFLEKCRSIGASALSCHKFCAAANKSKKNPPRCSCEAVGVPCADNCPSEEDHPRKNAFGRWPSDLRCLEGVHLK